MSETNEWAKYLPVKFTVNTGEIDRFKEGQVWAAFIPGATPYVYRVVAVEPQGYAQIEVLAGNNKFITRVHKKSQLACHSVLCVTPKPTEQGVNPPGVPTKKYIDIVERILVKAGAHAKAGRGGQFNQVYVPKEDWQALVEYFGSEQPAVYTAIGLIEVHPLNPDGVTFSE